MNHGHAELGTGGKPRLAVIVPALDEERTVGDVVRGISRLAPGIGRVDVVVVDDGSSDRTAEAAREAGAEVVRHDSRRGVGAAFATGIDAALRLGADYVVNIDADGQFDPADIPKLLEPLLRDEADFVTCTRFALPDYEPEMPRLKRWGNRMMCRIINWIIWNADFTDVSCGFRAYTREAALQLNLFGQFTYTQETFIDLAAKGVRMTEVPLRVRGEREHGTSRMASSLWRYGINSLLIILRSMRDTRPLKFFGIIAAVLMGLGLLVGLFVSGWWLATGQTHPFKMLIVISGTLLMLGFVVGVLALLADMIGRSRRIQEQILLAAKRRLYDREAPLAPQAQTELQAPQTEPGSPEVDTE